MYITVKVQLNPTDSNIAELLFYEKKFKQEIFKICGVFKKQGSAFEYRFKNISNDISWDSKAILLSKAKEMYTENKNGRLFHMDFSSIWNTKSFNIDTVNGKIKLKLGKNQNFKTLEIPIYNSSYFETRISQNEIIVLKICHKVKQWIAYFTVKINETISTSDKQLGIDVGIKVPAVTYSSDGKVRFFGNGRQIRYFQRKYRSKYRKLQAMKNHKKMTEMNHKLHSILKDKDHKISKEIINYAIKENIGIIKMERLNYINKSFNIKIESNIYLWSYRRLQYMIEYKAKLYGIRTIYVDPRNTSKICPKCGSINLPKDRLYYCKQCGYKSHRDLVGAINIQRAL